ncbi:hypothetical protein [Paraburkholderia susongensis]|uniref:hypothetical protein n=1 Tax=Paraburkholderia susongensis TaxID=1515439 RepID=UPI000A1CD782|nr:hypothetical protein [Paraburkholderia susongensis]
MTLTQIIRAGADYAGDAHIEVNSAQEWVSIGDEVFLQGDEARVFIDEAERLWNEAGDVGIDECWAHLAGPYLDSLE